MAAETTPVAQPVADALRRHPALAALGQRLAESNARYACILPCLPAGLAAHVQPGPLDDEGWSLLAANAAVAAKLRHLLPRLQDTLLAQGWQATAIRVRLQAPR
jgi:hypothetical protein